MNTDKQTSNNLMQRTWRRAMRMVGLAGVGLTVATMPVAAQQPANVPQHWISYAQMAGNQFEAWLSAPANEKVVRLHSWMQQRMLADGQPLPPPPLVVRVWVAPGGKVEEVKFASLGQAQADDDLRSVLVTQSLSEPPPKDMLQPMVLQLTLQFNTGS